MWCEEKPTLASTAPTAPSSCGSLGLCRWTIFFFQAEDGIRDADVTGVQNVCSSDLRTRARNDFKWFRALVRGVREEDLEDRFRMFVGTRVLIDAGALIGAHGAIPATTANIAPRSEERRVGKAITCPRPLGGWRRKSS